MGESDKKRGKKANGPSARAAASISTATAAAPQLSHPEKLLWPDAGFSKQNLLDHYSDVWPRLHPQLVDRPLALVRAPEGIGGPRFFQKHAMPGMPASIHRGRDPEDGEEILYVRDFGGVAALVQLGVVEIHVWGSTVAAIGLPDMMVFDLDPDEGLGVEAVRMASLDIKVRLDALGFPSFLKTSGGKGFHIMVPLVPKADWTSVKDFAHAFAQTLENDAPDRYTATLSKKARSGRIFVDYLRNGRGSTTAVAYSSRAKPAATVSVPVPWAALPGLQPDAFTLKSPALGAALASADPWQDFDAARKVLDLGRGA